MNSGKMMPLGFSAVVSATAFVRRGVLIILSTILDCELAHVRHTLPLDSGLIKVSALSSPVLGSRPWLAFVKQSFYPYY